MGFGDGVSYVDLLQILFSLAIENELKLNSGLLTIFFYG